MEPVVVEEVSKPVDKKDSRRKLVTVLVLTFVNLTYYADKYGIAGILIDLQCAFDANDFEAGLLQTAYVAGYVISAPVIGYLGDRYSRKWIIFSGMALWSGASLGASFMQDLWGFIGMRALLGLGEACYAPLVPGIIADMYAKEDRSKYLALFFLSIPIGSGIGFILFSVVTNLANDWRWGLRVTPIAGFLSLGLILLLMTDPPRGQSDGSQAKSTDIWKDVRHILKTPSVVTVIVGSVGIDYFLTAIAAFGPKFLALGQVTPESTPDEANDILGMVSLVFGAISMTTGLLGVIAGAFLGIKLRVKYLTADPLICGFGVLASIPFNFVVLVIARGSVIVTYIMGFFGFFLLNLYWALANDMLMSVVVPTRRASAKAFQSMADHIIAGAAAPLLTGVVSDAVRPLVESSMGGRLRSVDGQDCTITSINLETALLDYTALQYALFIAPFFLVIGAFSFIATSWTIVKDKVNAAKEASGETQDNAAVRTDSTVKSATHSE